MIPIFGTWSKSTDKAARTSAFIHRKDCGDKDLAVGQAVSFVFEQGPKGASAKNVKEEEGGEIQVEEEEGERELGKVKTYNEEKGFTFIVSTVFATQPAELAHEGCCSWPQSISEPFRNRSPDSKVRADSLTPRADA